METERSVATLAEVEREHILSTLARCGGNRTLTANVLGISVRGLRLKLHGYQQAGFEIAASRAAFGHVESTTSSLRGA